MNSTVFWVILLVVLLAVEIVTMGLTTIWFAIGSLVAAIVSAVGGPVWLQIALFCIASLVSLVLTRPIAVKYFNKDRVRTNAESLLDRQAIVISEINNLQGTGQVNVGGQEWSAKALDEQNIYPVGTVVLIKEISGVKLIVEEKKNEREEEE